MMHDSAAPERARWRLRGGPIRRRLSVAALVLCVGLFGAGCSSDDEDASAQVVPSEIDDAARVQESSEGESSDAGSDTGSDDTEPSPTPAPSATASPTVTPVPAATPTPEPERTEPEPGTGGQSTGPLDEADIEIETDEGTIQIGEADVPDGVDAAFPLPDDFEVQLSSATEDQFGFSGVTALSLDDLKAFYSEGLVAAGYDVSATQEVEGVLAVYSFEADGVEGDVAISQEPGGDGSSILVTIGAGSERFSIDFGSLDLGGADDE